MGHTHDKDGTGITSTDLGGGKQGLDVSLAGGVAISGTVDVDAVANSIGLATSANQTTLLTELLVANGGMALLYDDVGSGIAYQGWAEPGTATSAASWRIRKIDSSADPDITITWADGDRSFDNVWDNRAALSYS